MSSLDYSSELASALDRLIPAEALVGEWEDVVARLERRPSRRRPRRPGALRLAIVLAALVLLLAGVATATYLIVRGPGRVTVIGPDGPVASVVGLDAAGRPKTLWRCPHDAFCGEIVSAAWAPDGRLALSVGTIVAANVYDGVHVIDVATGTDRQLPAPPARAPTTKAGLVQTAVRLFRQEQRIFGCGQPQTLSWSPDGSRLAYACIASRNGEQSARIYTIRPDGTGRRLLRTHTAGAYWPSWSPDGKEIAFSSGEWPSQSAIYTIDLDGAHQHFVTKGAAPDWSPDGTAIAYRGASCAEPPDGGGEFASVRLVTASGRDITPVGYRRACRRFGPFFSPIPAWSPDGRRLAISTTSGLYVGNRDGSSFRRFALDPGRGLFGLDRPAWQPHPRGGTK